MDAGFSAADLGPDPGCACAFDEEEGVGDTAEGFAAGVEVGLEGAGEGEEGGEVFGGGEDGGAGGVFA